jgi:hypothetical protein
MALTTLPTAAFATGSVGTSQLADGAVTTEKLVADVNFRNLIINGDMSIAQRGTSASSLTVGGYSTQDRWIRGMANAGTWTQSQDTDVPTGQGFAKSLKLDCTTASTPIAADGNLNIGMRFEGQMLQQLKYGTSNAESLTLSFWVKSTKTGTFYAEFYNFDDTRHISKSYTVNASDTWEKKTITFEGDIAGTITNDNTSSLYLLMWLAAGSNFTSGTHTGVWEATVNANRLPGQVNCADSTSNNFYLTGVQLEVGTSASDFEFLPYDVNLQRCQRYYQRGGNGWAGWAYSGNNSEVYCGNITPMRAGPAVSYSGSSTVGETGGVIHIAGIANYTITGLAGYDSQTITGFLLNVTTSGNASQKTAGIKGCPFIMESEL